MAKRREICGIYKITSPSGRVYIGQSSSILDRFTNYNSMSSCKPQHKLYNSFLKYGVKSHIFEIIEECNFEDLNCRERFWQDEFDVLNGGLNCILQECGEIKIKYSQEIKDKIRNSRMGEKNPMYGRKGKDCVVSKKVINTETLQVFDSVTEAYDYCKLVSYASFCNKLKGRAKNNTSYMFLSDFEKFGAKEIEKVGLEITPVRDTLTLKKYNSITEASNDLNITSANLSRYLSGARVNPTYCIYEKDYAEGIIHYPEQTSLYLRVIDNKTGIIYNTVVEAAEKIGISTSIMRNYLANIKIQKDTDFKYLDKVDRNKEVDLCDEKVIRVKYDLIEKAYQLNLDRIKDGDKIENIFVTVTKNESFRKKIYNLIDKTKIFNKDGSPIIMSNIPTNRCPDRDILDFGGIPLTVSEIIKEVRNRK